MTGLDGRAGSESQYLKKQGLFLNFLLMDHSKVVILDQYQRQNCWHRVRRHGRIWSS